jgi:hypothetical protein
MGAAETEDSRELLARALAEFPGVRLAFLFGSRARGRAHGESDFDVAVLVDEALAGREQKARTIRRLAGRLGREVSSPRLDLVLLNDAPALLRHRVLRDGIVLFQRSPEERVRFTTRTIREYQDGFIRREAFTKKRIERLKSGATDGGSRDLLEKARGVARLLRKAQSVS